MAASLPRRSCRDRDGIVCDALVERLNQRMLASTRVVTKRSDRFHKHLGIVAAERHRLCNKHVERHGARVDPTAPQDDETIAALLAAARPARRVARLCTGAFLLAQMGLLDGRRATTHWAYAQMMRDQFPAIRVEDDRIFINEGPVWTSAGLTAGLDVAVALIEKDLSADVARSVARRMVMHHRRAGGQSQHSELLDLAPSSDRIQKALIHARSHLANLLTVEELAEVAALSPRQFSRAFRAETGQSPVKAVEQLRLEAARLLLEDTRHGLEAVARETGFVDLRRMREAFVRHYGQPPQAMRRVMRAA